METTARASWRLARATPSAQAPATAAGSQATATPPARPAPCRWPLVTPTVSGSRRTARCARAAAVAAVTPRHHCGASQGLAGSRRHPHASQPGSAGPTRWASPHHGGVLHHGGVHFPGDFHAPPRQRSRPRSVVVAPQRWCAGCAPWARRGVVLDSASQTRTQPRRGPGPGPHPSRHQRPTLAWHRCRPGPW